MEDVTDTLTFILSPKLWGPQGLGNVNFSFSYSAPTVLLLQCTHQHNLLQRGSEREKDVKEDAVVFPR